MTSGEVFRISAESDCVSGIEVDGACELTARERVRSALAYVQNVCARKDVHIENI